MINGGLYKGLITGGLKKTTWHRERTIGISISCYAKPSMGLGSVGEVTGMWYLLLVMHPTVVASTSIIIHCIISHYVTVVEFISSKNTHIIYIYIYYIYIYILCIYTHTYVSYPDLQWFTTWYVCNSEELPNLNPIIPVTWHHKSQHH